MDETKGKKGLALLILEHAKSKGALGKSATAGAASEEDGADEDAEPTSDAGLESAMEDLMAAFKADNAKAAVEAFKSLIEQC